VDVAVRIAPPILESVAGIAEQLAPLVPACLAYLLAGLATILSYRLPLFKHRLARRIAKRFTNRLTNLSPHIRIAAAERLAACITNRLSLFKNRLARRIAKSLTKRFTNLGSHRLAVDEQLASLVPTRFARLLAGLAAILSYRRPVFKHRLARCIANRLTNRRLLATHATRASHCKNHQNK
jgi:hypothetical protein